MEDKTLFVIWLLLYPLVKSIRFKLDGDPDDIFPEQVNKVYALGVVLFYVFIAWLLYP